MLQKLALAVKSKTIELFAEEDEEDEDHPSGLHYSPDQINSGQRVVFLKQNNSINDLPKSSVSQLSHALISSLFAALSSFHAAYLAFQIAHEPIQPDAVAAADRAAVLHLRRLSDLRRTYYLLLRNSTHASSDVVLSSPAESQVQENQSMLRKCEAVFNRLQSDVDRKEEEVSQMKVRLKEIEARNTVIERTLDKKVVLSFRVLEIALRKAYRAAQAFTKIFIKAFKASGGDIEAAVVPICGNLGFLSADHRGLAFLSHFCLGMFDGFLCKDGPGLKKQFLEEFSRQCGLDPSKILAMEPEGNFAKFCEEKYRKLVKPSIELFFSPTSSVDESWSSWGPSNPLYEAFLGMSSSVWEACSLAKCFEKPIEIFRVRPGVDFSVVFMENVLEKNTVWGMNAGSLIPKVGFTVFPGFQYGLSSTIQCKVYLDYRESS